MPGQELRLGPFIGGLNLYSDPSSVADTEMVSCINYEVGIDGSLGSRPPVVNFSGQMTPAGSMTKRIKVLLLAKLAGTTYLISSTDDGVYYSIGAGWTLISANASTQGCEAAIQYGGKVWFFPRSSAVANGGGTWDGTTFVALATLPPASSAITFKERAWIVPGPTPPTASPQARLQFSLTADPGSWNTGDATFIDINPGDGKALVDLITYQDNILLFKEDSTYALAFDSVPSAASLKKINNIIGASFRNNVVSFENTIYVFHRNWVYEIVNYQWARINVKVPFGKDTHVPGGSSMGDNAYFLTIVGDRLIVKLYSKIYVFGLRTRTWTEFKVSEVNNEHWFGPFVRWPQMFVSGDGYIAGSSLVADTRTFMMQNDYNSVGTAESAIIICTMQTKNFDSAYGRRYRIFSYGQRYKRMHWWGVDCVTSQSVTGTVTPIVSNFSPTWGQVKATPWSSLGTWQQAIGAVPPISTTYPNPGLNARHFIKFLQGLRYRQVNFQVQLQTDGTPTIGQAHLFGIINVMEVKEIVTKGSN